MDVKLPTLTLQLLYFEYAVLTTAWLNRPIPVLEHDNVTLLCAVEGTMWAGQRIDWYYNGLTHIYRYEGQDRHIGYGKWATRARANAPFQLTIRNVSVSDDGFYTCDVGYPSRGVRRIRSAVNVAVPVTGLQVLPLNTTFMEGTVADVSCFSLGGKPAPNLHWVNKTGAEISRKEHETQLKINITAKYNQNRLVCEAEQNHPLLKGHRIQQEITLNVLYGPRVTVEVKEGRNLTITFRVNANPPPMYVRLTKGKTLNVEQDNENILKYTKINVNKSDAGIYLFTAANSVNRTVISITLEYHCGSSGECVLVRPGKVIPRTDPTDNSEGSTTRDVIITSSVVVPTIAVCLCLLWRKCGRKEPEYSPHHDSTDLNTTTECKTLVNPDYDDGTPSTLLQYSV